MYLAKVYFHTISELNDGATAAVHKLENDLAAVDMKNVHTSSQAMAHNIYVPRKSLFPYYIIVFNGF